MRKFFWIGILAISSFSIASAKSYHITLDNPTQAGRTMLTAGEYRVKLEGSNAVFTNERNAKTFTAPVKVENSDKKHDTTAVEVNQQNGTDHIHAIELGGSHETLEFGD